MFSESCSAVSLQWDRDVSTGTSKSMRTRLKRSTSLVGMDHLRRVLHRKNNIPLVNSMKYLCVIFYRKSTWRIRIETMEAKACRTFIRVYSLFKNERLNANIKLTLHIWSVMTYACPAWEFAADAYYLKFQRPQNRVLRTIGNFLNALRSARSTPTPTCSHAARNINILWPTRPWFKP
jgi:hypothetical protein